MTSPDKITQLQMMEHNLQQFLLRKQGFQSQFLEIESALSELDKTESAYKILGNIMVKTDRSSLKKELEEKRHLVNLHIKSLERQEEKLKEQASKAQSEVLASLKKE